MKYLIPVYIEKTCRSKTYINCDQNDKLIKLTLPSLEERIELNNFDYSKNLE